MQVCKQLRSGINKEAFSEIWIHVLFFFKAVRLEKTPKKTHTHTHLYIYIYIYILSSTGRSVSFYQNSSVWLDILDSRSWDRNPVDSNANPRLYPYIYIYIYTLTHTHAHTYIYTHTHTHTHIYIYIYILFREKNNIRSLQDNKFISILLRALIWINNSKIISNIIKSNRKILPIGSDKLLLISFSKNFIWL